ncbi:hypothetical protein GGS24DRAFT_500514 [Hypoxylon argillaceum]|nr:hypothetical protein GGS24DRAFT_500514 [Hypoxylon argillaceum]
MAVLNEVPGLKVTIQVDGQNVTEYEDPRTADPSPEANPKCPAVSKYIEAIDDMQFSVKVKIDGKVYAWGDIRHILKAKIIIDGSCVGNPLIRPGTKDMTREGRRFYSKDARQWYLQKFKFSMISRDDNHDTEQIEKTIKDLKNMGLIQISLWRRVAEKKISNPNLSGLANTSRLRVAEKALKKNFSTHYTSFGKEEIISKVNHCTSRPVAGDNGPIGIFRFMYRSQEGLKQELVIPRTPSPELVAPIITKSVYNMTKEEVYRLAQEQLDQLNSGQDAKSRNKSAVKREISEIVDVDEDMDESRAAKRPAVTIDLTDD